MPLVIDPTIVKIAVELEDRAQLGQLIKFDQKSPLTGINNYPTNTLAYAKKNISFRFQSS